MWKRLSLVLALGALASACGPENSLEGSIARTFSLEFDRVAIFWQEPVLIIEYLDDVPGATYKVVKLSLDAESLTVGNNSDIIGDIFIERVKLERVTQTVQEFPVISGGVLHFDTYTTGSGKTIKGNFHVQFDNGLNLAGKFEGEVKHVSPDVDV